MKMMLVGRDIAHSKSPALYEAAFEALGLEGAYELCDVESEEAARALLLGGGFDAANVTTPYKQLGLSVADIQDSSAVAALGANLLIRVPKPQDGEGADEGAEPSEGEKVLAAFNTDGQGCIGFLIRQGIVVNGARVAVCGSGPTTRAIMGACEACGAHSVTMLSRRALEDDAVDIDDLAASASAEGATETRLFAYTSGSGKRAIQDADIVIDATILGMQPDDPAPFDTSLLHKGQVVLDTVYGRGETALIRAAKTAGCRCFDGLGMLVTQAVIALQLVCAQTGVSCSMDFKTIYDAMAKAAGLDL